MALVESVCLSPHKSDHLYVRVVLSSEEMTVTSVILLRFYSSFNRVALTTLENKIGTGKLQDILVLYCSNTVFPYYLFYSRSIHNAMLLRTRVSGSAYRLSGRILLMSGSDGHVIKWMGVPDDKESYYSPQLYTWPDGTKLVLFGTGGETHGGSLWVVKLVDVMKGDITQVDTKL